MGTKDLPQKSMLILWLLSASIMLSIAYEGWYFTKRINTLENVIIEQQSIIGSQKKTVEEQGSLLDQHYQELKTLIQERKTLTEHYQSLILQKDKQIQQLQKKKVSLPSRGETKIVQEFFVMATSYTAYCQGCSGKTAWKGINLRKYPETKVIAVDPSVIPLGTKVYVEGYGYATAADTGGAIKGYKIDLFYPEKEQALEWGRRKVKIRILQ